MSAVDADCLAGLNVLIVEDEAMIAMDLEDVFLDHGAAIAVPPVATCAKALDTVQAIEIDFALLDVALPDGDVFPVAEALVARGVPIAFHSGHAARTDVLERFPESGWIVKPSDPAELVRTVLSVVGSSGQPER